MRYESDLKQIHDGQALVCNLTNPAARAGYGEKIAHAANCHADLLAALKHIYAKCDTDSVIEITQEVMDECAAALAKAKGQS